MLSRKATTVSRRARYAVRLPDHRHGRPHGRGRGYARPCNGHDTRPRGSRGSSLGVLFITGGVLLFLAFVVAGAFAPKRGPLTKHEPVSTARTR